MIVVQQSYFPAPARTQELVESLCRLRDSTSGRVLVPFSGLVRQVIWEQHAVNLSSYDDQRRTWERKIEVGNDLRQIDQASSDALHRIFTVVGDDDLGCPVRKAGIVVQALYTPAHGKRARAVELLRQWQREWAKPQLPAMKGRVLGFFSTGQTHDLIWQAEFESAAEYDRLYRQWSDSPAFDDWAREFRDAIVSNIHSILRIVD